MKGNKSAIGVGLLTAVASSLCCITPLLALLAGTTGFASTFQWIEPLRPYMIALTIAALGFAWYQQLKPVAQDDCGCEVKSTSFFQGKPFLGIVTVFAALMLTFPYYSGHLYASSSADKHLFENTEAINLASIEFEVSGMTCKGCEIHVAEAVSKLEGILTVAPSYENGNALVEFDSSKATIQEIKKAIASTGYKVMGHKGN